MKKRILLAAGIIVFVALCLMIFRPVPILPEEELKVAEGKIERIFEGGEKDIVFKLRDSEEFYYINRGLEQGYTLTDLRAKLIGRQVTIKYPEYWSLLGSRYTHHLSKLEYRGEVVFSELE